MKTPKALLILSLLIDKIQGSSYTDIRGIGSYSEDEYPLCQETPLFISYTVTDSNDFTDEYGLQTQITMTMLQDKKCSFIFDGVNSNRIQKLYLPSPFDSDYSGDLMGRYVSYEWDKYIIDQNGDCVFDYKGNFGGLEGVLWDIHRTVDEPIEAGEVCAFNFYFESAACGSNCDDDDLKAVAFTYTDTQVYRDFWGQLLFYTYFNFLMIVYFPVGWLFANTGDFNWYMDLMMTLGKDTIPHENQSYRLYFNDEDANLDILIPE